MRIKFNGLRGGFWNGSDWSRVGTGRPGRLLKCPERYWAIKAAFSYRFEYFRGKAIFKFALSVEMNI